ncbi:MAG TPA: hypothetical protein VFE96_04480 [Candidatus Bathyarchaeia archaeon]|jgi:hypothetical protein|nr:hypothetical protein [Candidatus Bathyarchaeia archaeon]
MSSFTKDWARHKTRSGTIHRPVLDLLFREKQGYNLYTFIVDSGADISLAPKQMAERIGVNWAIGSKTKLSGISPKPECSVVGRIHTVGALLPDLALELNLPVCFADGNAPYLIGREGFFDRFKVTLDKKSLKTSFTTSRP